VSILSLNAEAVIDEFETFDGRREISVFRTNIRMTLKLREEKQTSSYLGCGEVPYILCCAVYLMQKIFEIMMQDVCLTCNAKVLSTRQNTEQ
jgi:hypothetical protein